MFMQQQRIMPGRIFAALQFLDYTRVVTAGYGDETVPGKGTRELHEKEKRVKDAALQVLLEYFQADGDDDAAGAAGDPAPNPQVPVPK
jgi:hypothetical protein